MKKKLFFYALFILLLINMIFDFYIESKGAYMIIKRVISVPVLYMIIYFFIQESRNKYKIYTIICYLIIQSIMTVDFFIFKKNLNYITDTIALLFGAFIMIFYLNYISDKES